ncbi:uncharacterized protein [Choristoneura fumiferana]|uniref:uncharacterized protein n=1 Tax=Choristoneura fumiferana TaxID=7141 RepID=UPI003D157AA0
MSKKSSAARSPSGEMDRFKDEIKEILTTWKSEQDKYLKQVLKEQNVLMCKLSADISELKAQNMSIQKTNLEIEKSVAFINQQYEEIKRQIDTLHRERKEYLFTIEELEKKVLDLQLSSRCSSVEIRNVPATENESAADLTQIVSSLGKVLSTSTNGIRDIYRVPGKPDTIKPIVVEFNSVDVKNKVITAAKTYNKGRSKDDRLNTSHIGLSKVRQPIYVAEHLPSSIKKLFFLAREFSNRNNFRFCWSSNGKVFLRKEQGAKYIVVKSEQTLRDLQKEM